MSLPSNVVPAYPYEGAVYWLLGEPTVRHSRSHGYYATLYGSEPERVMPRAGALLALFDRIELAGADHALPDRQVYLGTDEYFHPDLRIAVSHREQDHEWTTEAERLSDYCLANRVLQDTLGSHSYFGRDEFHQKHFVSRLLLQVRLAVRNNAALVGDSLFRSVYARIAPFIPLYLDGLPNKLPEGLVLDLEERTLTIAGLDFSPASYDAFAAIRTSSDITKYSQSFRAAIGTARESDDLHSTLIELMRQAMAKEEVARRAVQAFQTTGSVLNVAGLVPFAGTVAGVANIGADVVGRFAASKAKSKKWYLIGSEMKAVAIQSLLRPAP